MIVFLWRCVYLSLLSLCLVSTSSRIQYFDTASSAAPLSSVNEKTQARSNETCGKLPLSFEANYVQADPRVKFHSHGGNYNFLFAPENDQVYLALFGTEVPLSQRAISREDDDWRRRISSQTTAAQPTIDSPGSLIFRSDDRGEHWTAAGSLPNVVELVADPVASSSLFAATRIGLYKSMDGGATWNKIGNGLPAGAIIKLVFDPQNSSTLYTTASLTDASAGVFKSTDGGVNWTRTATANFRASLIIAPSNPATIYAVGDSLFKSTDGGISWNPINRPTYFAHGSTHSFGLSGFAIAPSSVTRLYVSTLAAGDAPLPGSIYRSVDGGANWLGSTMFTSSILTIDPHDPQIVYAKSLSVIPGMGIYKTIDGGDTWTQIDAATPGLFSVTSLIVSLQDSLQLYAPFGNNLSTSTPKGGVYGSKNGGESWSLLSTANGLPDRGIAAVAIDASNSSQLYAATVPGITSVSAASYEAFVAPESIASLSGTNLTIETGQATSIPLPISLAGVMIKVRDVRGIERDAPLFYASPLQVNFLVPEGTAPGVGTISVVRGGQVIAADGISILNVSAGVFSAEMNGKGVAAALAQRLKADGSQSYEPIAQYDQSMKQWVSIPIDLGPESDQVYLAIFGTGWRFRSSESAVKATIGSVEVPVTYAGAQPTLIGVDQINVRLPRSLAGKGEADLVVTVDGKTANVVKVNIK